MKKLTGIQFKISSIIVIVVIVHLIGYAIYDCHKTTGKLTLEMNWLKESIARRLAVNLVDPIWNMDRKAVEAILLSEMIDPRVCSLVVFDHDTQQIFSACQRDSNGNPIATSKIEAKPDLEKEIAIIHDTEKIACLHIGLTEQFLRQALASLLGRTVLEVVNRHYSLISLVCFFAQIDIVPY